MVSPHLTIPIRAPARAVFPEAAVKIGLQADAADHTHAMAESLVLIGRGVKKGFVNRSELAR